MKSVKSPAGRSAPWRVSGASWRRLRPPPATGFWHVRTSLASANKRASPDIVGSKGRGAAAAASGTRPVARHALPSARCRPALPPSCHPPHPELWPLQSFIHCLIVRPGTCSAAVSVTSQSHSQTSGRRAPWAPSCSAGAPTWSCSTELIATCPANIRHAAGGKLLRWAEGKPASLLCVVTQAALMGRRAAATLHQMRVMHLAAPVEHAAAAAPSLLKAPAVCAEHLLHRAALQRRRPACRHLVRLRLHDLRFEEWRLAVTAALQLAAALLRMLVAVECALRPSCARQHPPGKAPGRKTAGRYPCSR